jgi:hypothetical protein
VARDIKTMVPGTFSWLNSIGNGPTFSLPILSRGRYDQLTIR